MIGKSKAWTSAVTVALLAACPTIVLVPAALAQEAAAAEANSDEQTTAIVNAARAFIETLTDEQRAAVFFDFNDAEQRARWSNFPLGIFERAGVGWGDLADEQRTALTNLLGTVLSTDGLIMVQEQMAADDVLASEATTGGGNRGSAPVGATPPTGGPGGGGPGGLTFGSDYYYVSFVGEPSASEPWMLQFGGHHLAINATVVGSEVTLAPSLTGGQPVKFKVDGEEIYIVEDEVAEATALINGLSAEQQEVAVLGTESIDLVLGPGKDGMTLQPEGLPAGNMTEEQQALLVGLIEARLGILNSNDLKAKMADIEANLDATHFAWFGSTTDTDSAYWRVTGPTVLIEFSPQGMGGDSSNHLHNMYRDPTNDYGAGWTALE